MIMSAIPQASIKEISKLVRPKKKFNIYHIQSKRVRMIVIHLLDELEGEGAYLYHVSQFDSVYIKFKDEDLKSLRVADHNSQGMCKKYKYKWNLMIDGETKIAADNGIVRFYFSLLDIDMLISSIINRDHLI